MPDDSRRPASKRAGLDIRQARPADIDALVRIEADSFTTDKLSRRSFSALSRSRSATVLVACGEGRVLGYAVVLFRRGSRSARLYSIAVAAAEAGRGVGSRLLSAAENAARDRRVARVHLEVRADSPAAIRFYEERGYRRIGERSDYYEDGMTALLMARPLPSAATIAQSARRLRRAA